MPKEEIANHFELYNDSAVDRALKKSVVELTKRLTEKGWFYAMHIHQKSKIMKKGKMISVTYFYRPMFGEDKGSLEFDLTQPAENGYIIDCFAPQDKQYPFFKRLVCEVAKMQKAGQYPKDKLIVWWV